MSRPDYNVIAWGLVSRNLGLEYADEGAEQLVEDIERTLTQAHQAGSEETRRLVQRAIVAIDKCIIENLKSLMPHQPYESQ